LFKGTLVYNDLQVLSMKKLDLLNSNDSYRCCKLLKDLNLFSRADEVN